MKYWMILKSYRILNALKWNSSWKQNMIWNEIEYWMIWNEIVLWSRTWFEMNISVVLPSTFRSPSNFNKYSLGFVLWHNAQAVVGIIYQENVDCIYVYHMRQKNSLNIAKCPHQKYANAVAS